MMSTPSMLIFPRSRPRLGIATARTPFIPWLVRLGDVLPRRPVSMLSKALRSCELRGFGALFQGGIDPLLARGALGLLLGPGANRYDRSIVTERLGGPSGRTGRFLAS